MGRRSKLTETQWADIRRRVLEGEKPADLAREYDISKTAVSVRVSKRVAEVKSVADQIVDAERALSNLTVSEQFQALSLAAKLRSISDNMLAGATIQAQNFHRLSAMAAHELAQVDPKEPMKAVEKVKNSVAFTKAANEAAIVPTSLITAASTKDALRKGNEDLPPESTFDVSKLSDGALVELLDARGQPV